MRKNLLPIEAIAAKLDLPEDLYEKRSPVSAKLSLELLGDARFHRGGKLILVTATTPTVSGEGKTVTSIGLVQGLETIGKRAILSSREPSLGPVFGMKGGAVCASPDVSRTAKAYSFQAKITQKIAVAAMPVAAWGSTIL